MYLCRNKCINLHVNMYRSLCVCIYVYKHVRMHVHVICARCAFVYDHESSGMHVCYGALVNFKGSYACFFSDERLKRFFGWLQATSAFWWLAGRVAGRVQPATPLSEKKCSKPESSHGLSPASFNLSGQLSLDNT